MEVYEKCIRKGHQQNEIKIFAYFCIFIYIVCQAAHFCWRCILMQMLKDETLRGQVKTSPSENEHGS